MNWDFLQDGPSGPVIVLLCWFFAAAVDTMPQPPPGAFYYQWLYGFLHFVAANISRVIGPSKPVQTLTTTVEQTTPARSGGITVTTTESVQENIPVVPKEGK